MKQKDSVRAFKNEMRNYNYYLHRIVTLENSIEFMYDRLGGVRGIDPSKEPSHTVKNIDYEYKLRDDISRLEADLKLIESKTQYIKQILDRIENETREAIIRVYGQGEHMDKVARQISLSTNALQNRINKAIEKALQ